LIQKKRRGSRPPQAPKICRQRAAAESLGPSPAENLFSLQATERP